MAQDANILIFGDGAMAKVLYAYARRTLNIVGFTVDDHRVRDEETQFFWFFAKKRVCMRYMQIYNKSLYATLKAMPRYAFF